MFSTRQIPKITITRLWALKNIVLSCNAKTLMLLPVRASSVWGMLGADTTRGHCWRRSVIVPIVVKVGITVTGTAMLELTVGATWWAVTGLVMSAASCCCCCCYWWCCRSCCCCWQLGRKLATSEQLTRGGAGFSLTASEATRSFLSLRCVFFMNCWIFLAAWCCLLCE